MPSIKYPMVRSEDDRIWRKYCGFLDLSLPQFMSIQESLLLQQLEKAARCPLWKKFIGDKTPTSVDEFRHLVPLTTYQDYLPELDTGDGRALPEEPYVWAHTSGASGTFRRVPYTLESYNHSLENLMSALILACSGQKGQSSIKEGDRVLFNVAPSPYLSGILASGASQIFNLRPIISPDKHDGMDFKEKITRGFEASLRTGVDIMVAMTSVLVKTGSDFSQLLLEIAELLVRVLEDDRMRWPGLTAVVAPGAAASGILRSLVPMDTGVVIDASVRQLGEGRFAGAVLRKRIARVPGFAAVVAVDRGGVMVGPFFAAVSLSIVASGSEQSALVLAVPQRDAVFIHVHGGHVAVDIRLRL